MNSSIDANNSISADSPTQRSNQSTSYVGLDSSISGTHAKIVYEEDSDAFVIYDSGSTNGTWLRLSGMAEKSRLFEISDKSEILIGTVRFNVSIEEEIVERDVEM